LTSQDIPTQRVSRVSISVPARSEDRRRRLEAILPAFEPKLLEVAYRLCGDRANAKDLVQDAFERALRSEDVPPTEPRVRAWLYTILQNLFLDRCRHERARAQREGPLEPQVEETCAAPEPGPEPAWATITGQQLRLALAEVKEDFRNVYQMRELEGRSYDEIASKLGIARATVGTRLIRARARMRELLASLVSGSTEGVP
jgi:RNA polymerase sigma-70 factor, ECF subfamily